MKLPLPWALMEPGLKQWRLHGAHYQPRNACRKMFTDWLSGGHDFKPPTWGALIQSLRAVKLTETADLLSHTIKIVSFKRECTIIIFSLNSDYSGSRRC